MPNYIPDKEIDLIKEGDLLGTLPYVDTLTEIIKTCNTPFTIGLLGGWGSGKSSIVKTLQEKFESNKKSKIKVFIYDAWKYSKDNFRRTFILELRKFANLNVQEEKELFYQGKTKEIEHKPKINKWFVITFLILAAPSIIALFLFGFFNTWLGFFKGLGGISILSGVITFIMQFLKNSFIYQKITITTPKLFAPEQFEKRFRKTIEDYFSGKHLEKLIIVIDNIDRCHKELAVELLLATKNFLEIPNVVFIIPVDEEGIKKYLQLPNQDANEFLRKLFNTTIRIKNFTYFELFDFCKKLNEKYELHFTDTVLSIIAQEFAKNPRRVIQFLNNLQSEVVLAKKVEENGLIGPKGVVTGNIPMLAKLLIIKEEWPELYKLISDDPNLLNRINAAFREEGQFEKEKDENEKDKYKLKPENITLSLEEYRFLLGNSAITAYQLEPFLVNRDVFPDIPDEIYNLAISQDWDTIKEKYIEKGSVSLRRVIEFISQKLAKEVITRGLFQTSGFNFLSLLFKIANDKKFSPELDKVDSSSFAFNAVVKVCSMREIEPLIFNFNPSELMNFSKWLYDKKKTGLTNSIIKAVNSIPNDKVLTTEDKETKIIKTFVNMFKNKPRELEKIKDKFSKLFLKNSTLFHPFKEFLKNGSISKYLITNDLIKKFIDTLQPNPMQDYTSEKVGVLNGLCTNETISGEILVSYIEKIIQFANTNDWNSMNFWFNALKCPFQKIKGETFNSLFKKIDDLLNNRYQWLRSQYIAGRITEPSINCYKSFLYLSFSLYWATDKYKSQTLEWIKDFFIKNESPEIYTYINKEFYQKIVNEFEVYNWPFSQDVINRLANIGWPQNEEFAQILNGMLLKTTNEKGLTTQQIDSVLSNYLNLAKSSNQQEQSKMAKSWLKEVVENELVAERLQAKIEGMNNPDELEKLLDVVVELGNKALVETTTEKIILQIPCERISAALDKLLNKVDVKMIRGAVLKRIEKLNLDNDNQDRKCLKEVINANKIIKNTILEKIIIKLKPLLASNDKEKQFFALNCINSLHRIPKSKRDLLKVLLQNINLGEWAEEEKEILHSVEKRLI